MTAFTGTNGDNTLVFLTGKNVGFTGGSVAALNDGTFDTIADLGGADLVDLRGSSDIHRFFCGSGKDQLFGGSNSDLFGLGSLSDAESGEIIDGGGGNDTLIIQFQAGTMDLSVVSLRSIESLAFLVADGASATVKLNASQFTAAGVSLNLDISASAFPGASRNINIAMGSKAFIDFSGLTFDADWTAGDTFVVTGDSSFETITGTIVNDVIHGNGGSDNLLGKGGDDILDGGDGADFMDGGTGDDEMRGGAASDFYVVDSLSDLIIEKFTGGIHDLVTSGTMNIKLSNYGNVEDASLTGVSSFNISGNDLDNILTGNSGKNVIKGFDGNDRLDGGNGIDTLQGGEGDDFYRVDDSADIVIERAGEGKADEISTDDSFTLAADAEIEILRAFDELIVSNIDLTGNTFAQTIIGNAGANKISDGGGSGADVLQGKAGNDIYFVSNAGTKVVELSEDGTKDTVLASVSFALEAGADIEVLSTDNSSDVTPINLTGNALKQLITGNKGANFLSDGGGAADTLAGLAGNDNYIVGSTGTTILENAGNGKGDRVRAEVSYTLAADDDIEILSTTLPTGTDAIALTGNALAQQIFGNDGDNRLDGKDGNDTLTSFAGKDTFVFSSTLLNNVDTIVGFNLLNDTIELENGVFTALATTGALAANAFKNLTVSAKDANDRILYNQNTGDLIYDEDGSGSAFGEIVFANIANKAALTAADFVVA